MEQVVAKAQMLLGDSVQPLLIIILSQNMAVIIQEQKDLQGLIYLH